VADLGNQDYRRLEDVAAGHIRLAESGRPMLDRGRAPGYHHRGIVNLARLLDAGLVELPDGDRTYRLTPAGVEVLAGWRADRAADRAEMTAALHGAVDRRGR
jgi:hypothetical protein